MASNASDEDKGEDQEAHKAERRRRPSRGEASEEVEAVTADLGALVQAHPVGTLAAAVGIGYALGGGIFTRLTSRLFRLSLRLGMQFAVLPALERELATLVGLDKGGNHVERPPEKGRTHH